MRSMGAVLAFGFVLSLGPSTFAAGDKDHARLTLTGCVVAGDGKDSYMLTNVVVGGQDSGRAPENAFYRLESTKNLKSHVGHQVELSGTADLSDLDKGTLKIKTDEQGKSTASIDADGKKVTVPVDKDSGLVPAVMVGSEGSMKTEIATYKFKTSKIRMIGDRCR